MMKLVTVVIPNYNCEKYLDRCLLSVTSQTYKHIEILVCDDGSSDGSVSLIEKWAGKDTRIRLLLNPKNEGALKCYNRLFFEAQGDYICIMDADDWCDAKRVELQVSAIEEKDVAFCLTNSLFYYGEDDSPEKNDDGPSKRVNIYSKEVWAPATIMFKKDVLEEVPGFNAYFDRITSFDNYFILELLDKYGGYYLNDCLYFVGVRPDSDHRMLNMQDPNYLRKAISHDIYEELKRQRLQNRTDWLKENDFANLKEFEKKQLADKKYIADKIRMFACIQIDYGNFWEGKKLLKAAMKISPLMKVNYQTLLYYLKAKYRTNKALSDRITISQD